MTAIIMILDSYFVTILNVKLHKSVTALTLKRLGYFGSWKNWGGGGPVRPPLRSRPWITRSPQKFAQW